VLLDGVSVKSCAVLAVAGGWRGGDDDRGPRAPTARCRRCRTAFWEQHGVQCGFCTAGVLMSMTDLVQRHPRPSEAEIRSWMDGTMCRCGVYQNVVRAVQSATGQAR
jgi:aerobic-type carbon monoxide dehydrogenase small subunit (CoxS/CutS family)